MKAYKGGKSSENKTDIDPNLLRVIKQHEKKGRKVIPNESETKFSAMLLELIKPYHGPFPGFDELEKMLSIAVIAWNIACMKKMFPRAYKVMLEENKNLLAGDKEATRLLEKLIKGKEKKFPGQDMFIHDFVINVADDGQFYVVVTAKPFESFLTDTIMDDEDDDDEIYNFEPGYINRNAFIIKPRQPFIDWLKKIDGNSLFPHQIDENNIYLIKEKDSSEDAEKWLMKNFEKFFEMELEAWLSNEKLWPSNRNYKMFREWFDVFHHSMIYDLEDFPVDKNIL